MKESISPGENSSIHNGYRSQYTNRKLTVGDFDDSPIENSPLEEREG